MTDVLQNRQHNEMYTFSNQPRAAIHGTVNKKKFTLLDEIDEPRYANLMFDRRVVRGNTYALHHFDMQEDNDPVEIMRRAEMRRRAIARRKANEQLRPRSPVPVEGRQHQDVQTHLYLEEITERVQEADIEIQTDSFLDRPPTPLFIPAKTGADVSTQIQENDLFDFNIEVRPILEVLIGKTIEQACLEVMEEEELEELKAQQEAFEELRQVELLEQQRLAEKDRRLREEKKRRKDQMAQASMNEQDLVSKVLAKSFAKSYLSNLLPEVYANLEEHGYFYDPIERDIEDAFLPWLMEATNNELMKEIELRIVLDRIIRDLTLERNSEYLLLESPQDQKRSNSVSFKKDDEILELKTDMIEQDTTPFEDQIAIDTLAITEDVEQSQQEEDKTITKLETLPIDSEPMIEQNENDLDPTNE